MAGWQGAGHRKNARLVFQEKQSSLKEEVKDGRLEEPSELKDGNDGEKLTILKYPY